jgi:hypothetical protein
VDDFDVFKERMLGSGDKKPAPHRRALLFVDNAGADVVLGMLPLARELLRRGTEVSLLISNANEALISPCWRRTGLPSTIVEFLAQFVLFCWLTTMGMVSLINIISEGKRTFVGLKQCVEREREKNNQNDGC